MDKLIKTSLGYHSIEDMPTQKKLEDYYSRKYYQNDTKSHKHTYTKDELIFFKNKAKVAHYIVKNEIKETTLLDVGSGEGFFSAFFYKQNWDITTLDYSDYGISLHNPDLKNTMVKGDIFKSLEQTIKSKKKYGMINLSNVLEHVIDPINLLINLHKLLNNDSILRVSVPNDFSAFQNFLIEKNYTTNTWVSPPDHLHYFTFKSLENLLLSLNYEVFIKIGEYPIELFLTNESSNYVNDRNAGKHAHKSRVQIDNFLFDQGIKEYINYYKAAANIGFSRQAVIFAKKRS